MAPHLRLLTAALVATLTSVATIVATDDPVANAIEGEISLDGPPGSGCFGDTVLALPSGNIVITDPCFDVAGSADVGAVYLYDGGTRQQISRLVGNTSGDAVGTAVVPLRNGNVVVLSPSADLGGGIDVGSVTWVNGTTGLDGPITADNSLYGAHHGDAVGTTTVGIHPDRVPAVTALANGNYVVASPDWDRGATVDVGAVTWGDGIAGTVGAVTTANSLFGDATWLFAPLDHTRIGSGGVTALANGNYVVSSPSFGFEGRDGLTPVLRSNAGAVTWATGSGPTAGGLGTTNSLHGSAADDRVGSGGVTALANGHYVIASPSWSGVAQRAGAVTWGDGSAGTVGVVSTGNSITGTFADEQVGEVTPLANGNYVVTTWRFRGPPGAAIGAATIASGVGTTSAAVLDTNSVTGTHANDGFAMSVLPLTNGNYLVVMPLWDDGAVADVGAVRWMDGASASSGVVSSSNSLVGSTANDAFGSAPAALPNGHYVLAGSLWGPDDRGAVTWGDGTTGLVGVVGASNSVIGAPGDRIGGGLVALTDGNYVVESPSWGGDRGAITWLSGSGPSLGSVSASNSIVGAAPGGRLGWFLEPTQSLAGGAYLARSSGWNSPAAADAGAVTLGRAGGSVGVAGTGDSVVGRVAGAQVGLVASAEDLVHAQLVVPIPGENRVVFVGTRTGLVPVTPARLLETRPDVEPGTVDDIAEGGGALSAGGTVQLTVAGRGGVPADASAAVLNITATDTTAPGYVTAYPCGDDRPNASNLNFFADMTIPNAVIARLGTDGRVCLYSSATTNLIVDVTGFYPVRAAYEPTTPVRILETRTDQPPTADGLFSGAGLLPAGTTTELQITGRAGVPEDATITTLNVTVTDARALGFVTVYPCGGARPIASNLNHGVGQTIANLVITGIGADGTVCLYNLAPTHLVVDLNGWHAPDSDQEAAAPARLLETRPGADPTIDGAFANIGRPAAGSTLVLQVAGRGGVPADANVVSLNVTVTQPEGPGYVTVYPCDRDRPNASNLNYAPGQTIPNAVITGLAPDGTVCLYTLAAAHLIVDVNGWVTR